MLRFHLRTEAVFNIINPLPSCEAVAAGRYVWTEPLQAGKHIMYTIVERYVVLLLNLLKIV